MSPSIAAKFIGAPNENPVRTVEVEIFDIDVNSTVLELVVVATVDAGVKPPSAPATPELSNLEFG